MKKPDTYQSAMRKADAAFALYIRGRDRSGDYTRCVSCGKLIPYKAGQCGHYMSRRHLATRYDEINCHTQCAACNCWGAGEVVRYRRALVDIYGESEVRALEDKALMQGAKYSIADLLYIAEMYKAKLKSIPIT